MLETILATLEVLREFGLRCTLVCTVAHDTNLHEVGAVLRFGIARPIIRGVSYQLAAYCGRHTHPADLERRATMPDLVEALASQASDLVAAEDFYPLPYAHPNCHMMAYLYHGGGTVVAVSRLIDVRKLMDLIANRIVYTPARARHLVARAMEAAGGCCGPNGCGPAAPGANDFVVRALAEKLTGEDVFRVTLTALLDAHTFDTRRVMKCCLAHVLPSGHIVPFCAFNTLYRDGFVALPPLADCPEAAVPRVGLPLVGS